MEGSHAPRFLRNVWVGAAAVVVPLVANAQHGAEDVGVQMRNVDFHVDRSIVLHIGYLRGELQPTSPEHSPYFD